MEELRESFAARMEVARPAVRWELRGLDRWMAEEVVQEVWLKGWRAYARTVARAAAIEARGKVFNWVGWFVRIAQNVLRDVEKKGGKAAKEIGKGVSLDGETTYWEGWDDAAGSWRGRLVRLRVVDDRWYAPEALGEWDETVAALRECLLELPRRRRLVLIRWGHEGSDGKTAKKLGLSTSVVRRERVAGVAELRVSLEARGITKENRGRQPDREVWTFRRPGAMARRALAA